MGEGRTVGSCGRMDCGVSTGICGSLTFGRGRLDDYGYWEIPCAPCARATEKAHPEHGTCWPGGPGELKVVVLSLDNALQAWIEARQDHASAVKAAVGERENGRILVDMAECVVELASRDLEKAYAKHKG